MSDSLRPCGLKHTRVPCPSLAPRVCSNSCPLSQWCYRTISSSATHFSFCPQSFPASGSLPMTQLFAWGGRSIGASASVCFFSSLWHRFQTFIIFLSFLDAKVNYNFQPFLPLDWGGHWINFWIMVIWTISRTGL